VRGLFRIAIALAVPSAAGCANTWDTLGNKSWQREFARNPFRATISPEDPLTILRNRPNDGEARARAMRRLEEPLA
jgi:hypothetical protein